MPIPTKAVTSEPLVRFARKISHDLNNFSTVVRTYSELLLADLPPDSTTYADVAEIQRAAENMVQYLQRVTRFARAGAMKRTAVNVDAVATETVGQFRASVPDRVVDVQTASAATIQADPLWWRDVVLELLQNAHEAAPAGTTIGLATHRQDGEVLVEVSDDGPGFPAALSEQAAEPMVTAKNGVRGAGMGLALVAAFADTLGGTLAEERRHGRTVVTLRLPIG